ncbi:MAG TPA: hypothetical protein VFK43_05075, partial [Acidimicrobiales bacterium]|nr:hypothetical protein [Acidimicrobiales bacterium]
MEQRVSLITLGVDDLARARSFYEALGWHGQETEETVFFQAGGAVVVLWGREKLAADSGVEVGPAAFEVGEDERAVVGQGEAGVVGDLPDVAVGVGEAGRVPAVERLARRPGHNRAGPLGGDHDLVDL